MESEFIVTPVLVRIGKIDRRALLRKDLKTGMREDGTAAGLNVIEIHDQRCDAIAAILKMHGLAVDVGTKEILMRLVLRTDAVAHDLQTLTMFNRHTGDLRDAVLDTTAQGILIDLENQILAGPPVIQKISAGLAIHH